MIISYGLLCAEHESGFQFFSSRSGFSGNWFCGMWNEAIVAEDSTDAEIIEPINKDVTDADENSMLESSS